jgi:hypothetical protein
MNNWEYITSNQPTGYGSYHLYRLGWQHKRYNHLSGFEHILLSSFFYYRRGFTEAAEWSKQKV